MLMLTLESVTPVSEKALRKLRTLVKYISVCQFESFVQSNRKPVDKYDTREYPRPLDVHILYTSL